MFTRPGDQRPRPPDLAARSTTDIVSANILFRCVRQHLLTQKSLSRSAFFQFLKLPVCVLVRKQRYADEQLTAAGLDSFVEFLTGDARDLILSITKFA